MTSVTAKELRQNLSEYLDRMEAGEEIAVIRRSKIIGKMKPNKGPEKGNGPAISAAIKRYHAYIKAAGITFNADPNKSAKELYHEAMNNDPKYARYVTKK